MAGMETKHERTLARTSTSPMTTMDPTKTTSLTHFQYDPSPAPTTTSGERAANLQWGQQETVELISIRGELERHFTASKRNKALWETVASRMRDNGFNRTPDQCKCKWKNLVNRYKGKETSDPGNGKHCPFFDELHAVFSERAKNLQQHFIEPKQAGVQSRKKMKSNTGDQFSDGLSHDEDDDMDYSNEENLIRSSNTRKRKANSEKHTQTIARDNSADPASASFAGISSGSSILEMLKMFFQQQQRIEMQWNESRERHQHERELFEQEWQQSMEKLERERLMLDQEWREREEQRKMREEIQAEKRDTLLTTLLNKLINEERL